MANSRKPVRLSCPHLLTWGWLCLCCTGEGECSLGEPPANRIWPCIYPEKGLPWHSALCWHVLTAPKQTKGLASLLFGPLCDLTDSQMATLSSCHPNSGRLICVFPGIFLLPVFLPHYPPAVPVLTRMFQSTEEAEQPSGSRAGAHAPLESWDL